MLGISGIAARDKAGSQCDRHFQRVDRLKDHALRLHFCDISRVGRRRCLPFCEAVDLVIVDYDRYIDIPPDVMDEVVSPFAIAIAVTGSHKDSQSAVRDLRGCRVGERPAVKSVNAIALDIVRQFRSLPYP